MLIVATNFPAPAQVTARPASADAAANLTADRLVDELVENAARDHATLPSMTAHESIVSKVDEFALHGKTHVNAEANVRIARKSSEGDWSEIREYTSVNGKPVAPNTKVALPFTIANSFDDHQGDFFSAQNRSCYNFSLAARTAPDAPLELTITPLPGSASSHCTSRSGTARIDPATHRLIHLEFAYLPSANIPQWTVSVDYAATKVGDGTFNLPSMVATRIVLGKTPNEWTARYSDYHQYTSSVTIRPADDSAQ